MFNLNKTLSSTWMSIYVQDNSSGVVSMVHNAPKCSMWTKNIQIEQTNHETFTAKLLNLEL